MELDIRDVTEAWELLQDRPKTAEKTLTVLGKNGKKHILQEGLIRVKPWHMGWGGEELENFKLRCFFPLEIGDERFGK